MSEDRGTLISSQEQNQGMMLPPSLPNPSITSFERSDSGNVHSPLPGWSSPPTTPLRLSSSRRRFSSPPSSHRRTTVYSDRYIPSRMSTNLEEAFDLLDKQTEKLGQDAPESRYENQLLMNNLIRTEVLGQPALEYNPDVNLLDNSTIKSPARRESSSTPSNLFKYRSSIGSSASVESSGMSTFSSSDYENLSGGFAGTASPARRSSFLSPKLPSRKIPKVPFKILDAPALQDDYYLTLLDWSSNNVLSVALGPSIYLWSACTSKVTKLCDFGNDMVTSVSWATTGNNLSIGTDSGKIYIWDSALGKMVRQMKSHQSRVGTTAWSSGLLASGSRDRNILLQDIRVRSTHSQTASFGSGCSSGGMTPLGLRGSRLSGGIGREALGGMVEVGSPVPGSADPHEVVGTMNLRSAFLLTNRPAPSSANSTTTMDMTASSSVSSDLEAAGHASSAVVAELVGHRQEVCGLKWSFDEKMLASGGNDNRLIVWSPQHGRSSEPLYKFEDHTAAVKAVAWSPHQQGLLASGGGTADRHIRFWNATTGTALHRLDTGSQVCNLMWSRNVNELVSTHGYSLNQIIVWKYPSMTKLATLTGHTLRVLYLAMSPDGQTIVTGAGDETLRFWNIFPAPKNKAGFPSGQSILAPSASDVR